MNANSDIMIGVLALQGDFERHMFRLKSLGIGSREVRKAGDIDDGLDGLIVPGGESTTISMLIDRFKMRETLDRFCASKPVWGTCAGMIMLAQSSGDPRVTPLKLMDITVHRNSYGRQVHSFFAEIEARLNGCGKKLKASFIRAPKIEDIGPEVRVLAEYENAPVLMTQDKYLASSFHTELDDDPALTKFFVDEFVLKYKKR